MDENRHPVRAQDRHAPVMLQACVDLLSPALVEPGSVYVDATLGMGGHASAVLAACPHSRLIGIDRDTAALELARERLAQDGFADRIDLVHATYDAIPEVLAERGLTASAVMMDLGLSSFQIDTSERGFSYAADAPLDMRMDPASGGPTAADLLRDLDEKELARILREYGDERFAPRIARRIVSERAEHPLERSGELVDLLDRAIPAASRAHGGHPAKRSFQALRIAVNDELAILARAIDGALDSVGVGGRVVVESYHSGEDRLVKTALARRTRSSAPPDLPFELEEHKPTFAALTRGALQADEAERESNARSASVRLRAAERLRPAH
ncbi:16S rRNA (cytosine(1402)-N(4))-methyltransferase RsmH [Brachybacterium sp. MASK1Z-5]|uniref:Ribosomal RNA small subunit methyltransferase H n=1 Tax=Brachybacterium halotolerans TaxID=2795215 RepID=A0ABS1B796_9MICO|nr:16S rRNA (cytosine(1402)-N(4))-methyltransferase RsmH [Brachybacterium halotolerans]MBK0330523.1 16S rRNA (cytosine(1402)-N(4))-methyltransferase RsmH [Brachybacterium halotolerans]